MKKVERNYLQMQKSVIQYNQAKGNSPINVNLLLVRQTATR